MNSGKLNFLEPSGLLQVCNGTALPFFITIKFELPEVSIYQQETKRWNKSKIRM